jgi:hypothetical protein
MVKEICLPESIAAAGENFYHGSLEFGVEDEKGSLANWQLLSCGLLGGVELTPCAAR